MSNKTPGRRNRTMVLEVSGLAPLAEIPRWEEQLVLPVLAGHPTTRETVPDDDERERL